MDYRFGVFVGSNLSLCVCVFECERKVGVMREWLVSRLFYAFQI